MLAAPLEHVATIRLTEQEFACELSKVLEGSSMSTRRNSWPRRRALGAARRERGVSRATRAVARQAAEAQLDLAVIGRPRGFERLMQHVVAGGGATLEVLALLAAGATPVWVALLVGLVLWLLVHALMALVRIVLAPGVVPSVSYLLARADAWARPRGQFYLDRLTHRAGSRRRLASVALGVGLLASSGVAFLCASTIEGAAPPGAEWVLALVAPAGWSLVWDDPKRWPMRQLVRRWERELYGG